MQGVILYGPPASGKDTVTAALERLDTKFAHLAKLKVGNGRPDGYRTVTPETLDDLRGRGHLAAETRRYGNIYAVDRNEVADLLLSGRIPIAHMGNIADLRALSDSTSEAWLHVLLWIPRAVCIARSRLRGDLDTDDRLRAWDETAADLRDNDTRDIFHLRMNTDTVTSDLVAATIAATVKSHS